MMGADGIVGKRISSMTSVKVGVIHWRFPSSVVAEFRRSHNQS